MDLAAANNNPQVAGQGNLIEAHSGRYVNAIFPACAPPLIETLKIFPDSLRCAAVDNSPEAQVNSREWHLTRWFQGSRNTKSAINMSSLSRRACYKCGHVGHYAEVCTSSERLCYNCKQPGHESNQCPLPRTTESECPMTIYHKFAADGRLLQQNSAIIARG